MRSFYSITKSATHSSRTGTDSRASAHRFRAQIPPGVAVGGTFHVKIPGAQPNVPMAVPLNQPNRSGVPMGLPVEQPSPPPPPPPQQQQRRRWCGPLLSLHLLLQSPWSRYPCGASCWRQQQRERDQLQRLRPRASSRESLWLLQPPLRPRASSRPPSCQMRRRQREKQKRQMTIRQVQEEHSAASWPAATREEEEAEEVARRKQRRRLRHAAAPPASASAARLRPAQ